MGPGCVKTRTTGRQSINFSRFSAVFRHYKLGEAKKFASDATFSDNFRVFTQPGSKAVIRWPNPDHAVTPLFTLPARADLGWSSSFADPCE